MIHRFIPTFPFLKVTFVQHIGCYAQTTYKQSFYRNFKCIYTLKDQSSSDLHCFAVETDSTFQMRSRLRLESDVGGQKPTAKHIMCIEGFPTFTTTRVPNRSGFAVGPPRLTEQPAPAAASPSLAAAESSSACSVPVGPPATAAGAR